MKYTAELFGSGWKQGPVAEFATITAARKWAESYGTTADYCTIRDKAGRDVAHHARDRNGDGLSWYKSS